MISAHFKAQDSESLISQILGVLETWQEDAGVSLLGSCLGICFGLGCYRVLFRYAVGFVSKSESKMREAWTWSPGSCLGCFGVKGMQRLIGKVGSEVTPKAQPSGEKLQLRRRHHYHVQSKSKWHWGCSHWTYQEPSQPWRKCLALAFLLQPQTPRKGGSAVPGAGGYSEALICSWDKAQELLWDGKWSSCSCWGGTGILNTSCR